MKTPTFSAEWKALVKQQNRILRQMQKRGIEFITPRRQRLSPTTTTRDLFKLRKTNEILIKAQKEVTEARQKQIKPKKIDISTPKKQRYYLKKDRFLTARVRYATLTDEERKRRRREYARKYYWRKKAERQAEQERNLTEAVKKADITDTIKPELSPPYAQSIDEIENATLPTTYYPDSADLILDDIEALLEDSFAVYNDKMAIAIRAELFKFKEQPELIEQLRNRISDRERFLRDERFLLYTEPEYMMGQYSQSYIKAFKNVMSALKLEDITDIEAKNYYNDVINDVDAAISAQNLTPQEFDYIYGESGTYADRIERRKEMSKLFTENPDEFYEEYPKI